MPANGNMTISTETSNRAVIDLTADDPTDPSPTPQGDHMGLLNEQLCPRAVRKPSNTPSSPPPERRKSDNVSTSKKSRKRSSEASSPTNTGTPSFRLPPDFTPQTPTTPPLTSPRKRTPFRFLALPPELRNRIYTLLLTDHEPIEPWKARSTAAARSAAWAEAQKKRRDRRAFKKIFLEILCVSKQLHIEATGILYGSNVFKFRSDHKEGKMKVIPFAERYSGLLRDVKVAVISGNEHIGQDIGVAELLAKFVPARLDKFELTWYGWKKYRLSQEGPLCEALLRLNVEKVFRVIVSGEARVRTKMFMELTQRCAARVVDIRRPIFKIMREGGAVEVSDEEAG